MGVPHSYSGKDEPGHQQRPAAGLLGGQEVGRLLPVRRDVGEPGGRRELPGQRRGDRRHQRGGQHEQQPTRGERDRAPPPDRDTGPFGAGAPQPPHRDAGEVRERQHQRQADHRVPLVHVAQRGQRTVERVVQPARRTAPGRRRGGPATPGRPRPAGRAPARCARAGRGGTARPARPRRGPRCPRPGRPRAPATSRPGQFGPRRRGQRREPVRGPAQHAEHVGRAGRGLRPSRCSRGTAG